MLAPLQWALWSSYGMHDELFLPYDVISNVVLADTEEGNQYFVREPLLMFNFGLGSIEVGNRWCDAMAKRCEEQDSPTSVSPSQEGAVSGVSTIVPTISQDGEDASLGVVIDPNLADVSVPTVPPDSSHGPSNQGLSPLRNAGSH